MKYVFAILIVLCMTSPLRATASDDNALTCIKAEVITRPLGNKVTEITNTCLYDVKIFWCLNGGSTTKYQCGHGDKFFKWSTTLSPEQKRSNQYNLPADIPIQMEACKGRQGKDVGNGVVDCGPPLMEDVRTSDRIKCDDVMSTFVVYTPRPGIYRFESSDGSIYTYKTLKGGKDQPLDVAAVRDDICKVRKSDAGYVTKGMIKGRAIIKKSAKEHAAEVLAKCLTRHGEESCKEYARQAGSISG